MRIHACRVSSQPGQIKAARDKKLWWTEKELEGTRIAWSPTASSVGMHLNWEGSLKDDDQASWLAPMPWSLEEQVSEGRGFMSSLFSALADCEDTRMKGTVPCVSADPNITVETLEAHQLRVRFTLPDHKNSTSDPTPCSLYAALEGAVTTECSLIWAGVL
ncbi:hypothetical protein P7K49_031110 [Saguinus oedipus]|uniref:Uncharacterized protein n=1 Tax=Saguinus oedipus TaxID=9490 RepID=A0ABQ9U485_SAGOE|nr:hypothetical protein P7K49_031110 [Saguinus oedipus]